MINGSTYRNFSFSRPKNIFLLKVDRWLLPRNLWQSSEKKLQLRGVTSDRAWREMKSVAFSTLISIGHYSTCVIRTLILNSFVVFFLLVNHQFTDHAQTFCVSKPNDFQKRRRVQVLRDMIKLQHFLDGCLTSMQKKSQFQSSQLFLPLQMTLKALHGRSFCFLTRFSTAFFSQVTEQIHQKKI